MSLLALEMGLSAGGEKSFSALGGRLLESLCLPKDWWKSGKRCYYFNKENEEKQRMESHISHRITINTTPINCSNWGWTENALHLNKLT